MIRVLALACACAGCATFQPEEIHGPMAGLGRYFGEKVD
jgi:hypothetical protein